MIGMYWAMRSPVCRISGERLFPGRCDCAVVANDAKTSCLKRPALRIVLFIGIFLILFAPTLWLFSNHPDHRVYQMIGGFYEEPEDSLDGVYIGSSTVYAFWNPMVAWNNYGLAIYPYSSGSQPFYATEYIIREVRKTQPDAVCVVNLNSVDGGELSAADIHNLVNYMPDSPNRDALIDALSDLIGYSQIERLEFRVPWLRARAYWLDYITNGFFPELDGLKGTSRYPTYLYSGVDISSSYILSDAQSDTPAELEACIDHLLDYCDEEQVRVLFVAVPRAEVSEASLGRINTVCEMIEARGYDVLYLTDKAGELGLDLTQDYYNEKHTNIHGAIKFTNCISEYLVENYGLSPRSGDARSDSWDAAWDAYAAEIAPAVLDFELDAAHRDFSLAAPRELRAAADEGGVIVEWSAVEGADGYALYRKAGDDGPWEAVSAFQTQTRYMDADCLPGTQYTYTAVPVRTLRGERCYGNFSYGGASILR